MNKRQLLGLLASLMLAGCPANTSGTSGNTSAVDVQLKPQVVEGGLQTQAIVSPYGQADIHHLEIKAFKLNNSSESPIIGDNGLPLLKDILKANLGDTVTFGNLDRNTTYRFRAYAYLDPATASLISSASFVDVAVTDNDRPPMQVLVVQLIDKVFSGQATGGLYVATGSLVHQGNETLQ